MVQVDDSTRDEVTGGGFADDARMKPDREEPPSLDAAIREAVSGFSRLVRDSAADLTAAAQRFSAESGRIVEDVAARAAEAASLSERSADSARAAAQEARELLSTMKAAASETGEQVKQETASVVQDAIRRAEEALASSRQFATELQERVQGMVARVDESARASQSFAGEAASAAAAAKQAAATPAAAATTEAIARAAAEAARSAASDVEQLRAAVNAAAAAAEEARRSAAEATRVAAEPPTAPPGPFSGVAAQNVLERIETDFALLTRAIQELHSRVLGLTAPESKPVGLAAQASAPAPRQDTADSSPLSVAPPASSGPVLAGRALVSISPVPDFDRLLTLDGALGRMPGIGAVTLVDYAKEEVVFRIEIEAPSSAEDFCRRFSESAGAAMELVRREGDSLALRLVG